MQSKTPLTVDVTEAEERRIQRYADRRGLTLEQACTELAQKAIQSRFVLSRTSARIYSIVRGVTQK